ncbi:hypothetical protein T484DRAFT_1831867 [Baffinella frigidus]|nr:hypothetical protein T484DRAFT_1831867 [Cryptophyta sp. CCMP2293]
MTARCLSGALLLALISSSWTFQAPSFPCAAAPRALVQQRCTAHRLAQAPVLPLRMAAGDQPPGEGTSVGISQAGLVSRRAALAGAFAVGFGAAAPAWAAVSESTVVAPAAAPAAVADVPVVADAAAPEQKCDAAVSHLVKSDGSEIYLIGTAHISKDSAILVRDVIRAVRPDAVMVELDETRIRTVAAAANVWDLLKREFGSSIDLGQKVRNVEAGLIGMAISSLYAKLNTMGHDRPSGFGVRVTGHAGAQGPAGGAVPRHTPRV